MAEHEPFVTNKALEARIKSDLAEEQHRYQIHDPFAETTFRFPTAETATAKADELGASRLQHVAADGSITQVDKVDGQWMLIGQQEVNLRLADQQDGIDRASLRSIGARASQRAEVAKLDLDFHADKDMATADAFAFRRIQAPELQELAAIEMANNARQYPEYKEGLDKAIPGYPGTAEKVYALDAAYNDRIIEKEDRKAAAADDDRADYQRWEEHHARKVGEHIVDRLDLEISEFKPGDSSVIEGRYGTLGSSDWQIAHQGSTRDEVLESIGKTAIEATQSKNYAFMGEKGRDAIDEALQRSQRDADAFDVLHRDDPVMENSISDGRERAQTPEEAAKAIQDRREGIGDLASLDDKAAGKLARDDAHDLRLVKDHAGAELIAAAMRDNPVYRTEFVKADTELAQQVAAQDIDQTKNREGDRQQRYESLASVVDKATAEIEKPKLPAGIEDRYVSVEGRFFQKGKTSFFDREDTKVPAFVDNGKSLATSRDDQRTVADMVAMAKSKNWDVLNVKGTEEFRRQAWLEASVQGLEVKGYKPKEADIAMLKVLHGERSVNQIQQGPTMQPKTQDKAPEAKTAPAEPAERPQTAAPAKTEPDKLGLLERAKVAAAEKIFLAAVRNLPDNQRQALVDNLQNKLRDPANVQKLPTPQHYSKEQAAPQRESNRER